METFTTNRISNQSEERLLFRLNPGPEMNATFEVSQDFVTDHAIHMFMGVVLVLIGILGAAGNGLVLYVFTR